MEWTVVAFCQIDKENLDYIDNHIIRLLRKAGARNIENTMGFIDFELTGKGKIDYRVMDRIKKVLLKEEIVFAMSSCEFVEAAGKGYYFNSEEDEE